MRSVDTFAAELAARGIYLCLSGIRPKQAYRTLSDADRAFLREHRHELRQLVVDGVAPRFVEQSPVAATPVAAPAPAIPACPYCYGRPCIGEEHEAFAVLHHHDPEVRAGRLAAERKAEAQLRVAAALHGYLGFHF